MTGGKDAAARVRGVIRQSVLAGRAYHVADAAGLVKLDAMENPYPWPESLRGAWLEALRGISLNRYPDADAGGLKSKLRSVFSIPSSAEVLLGNGSDEIIQMLALAIARPGAVLLAPEPSFSMYRVIADVAGLRYVGVPLRAPDFELDRKAMLAAIEANQPALVILAYPNNPSGNLFAEADIEAILEAAPGAVVVDEAYHAFAGSSFLPRLERDDKLLVMRTLSKIGMAGLRLGFLAGAPAWIEQFEKLRLPYNIGTLTQASVGFFLDHMDVFDEQAARIRAERDRVSQRLRELPGIRAWPSAANFILARSTAAPAESIHGQLLERKLLIKSLHGAHPMLAECLRITIGSAKENDALLAALAAILVR
ncbi:MAG TPA: histidinol-phosphate transaminase [Gammaproteobacteria bacterium]|jgi:histidinol-phosphate aminotransferase